MMLNWLKLGSNAIEMATLTEEGHATNKPGNRVTEYVVDLMQANGILGHEGLSFSVKGCGAKTKKVRAPGEMPEAPRYFFAFLQIGGRTTGRRSAQKTISP